LSNVDTYHNDDSINEQLKRFENLKQKLEASPELQKQMNNNLDKLRRQNRLIHSDILKQLIDKLELLIIDQDMINALGYKMYIEHLISLVQHIWSHNHNNNQNTSNREAYLFAMYNDDSKNYFANRIYDNAPIRKTR
jgi:archaellum biogenesis ATPase FlaH